MDKEAGTKLADLFRIHAYDAKRVAYLMTGDRALAEDLTQDAFIRVAGRLGHLRDEDRFAAYLRKTVVNLVRMHYRRHAVDDRVAKLDIVAPRDADADQDLRSALLGLPHRQRAALVLRFYLGLTDNETADLLSCRLGTVRSLVSRGLSALRSEIKE